MLEFLAAAAEANEEVEPTAFGITPGGYVALAMIVVLLIMVRAGVPKMIAAALDAKIAGIKHQLDTAAQLRAEAEALKAEYEAKAKAADADIAAMKAGAQRQADEIVAKTADDATKLIARHQAMSEAKIAGAERAAIAEIRQRAASAATSAARELIAGQVDAKADARLVDEAIAGI